jgi:hypothetical protein
MIGTIKGLMRGWVKKILRSGFGLTRSGASTVVTPGSGGQLLLGTDGAATAPAFAFSSEPTTGVYRPGASQWAVSIATSQILLVTNGTTSGVAINSVIPLTWNADTKLFRDAANTLAQRNGTAAQVTNQYGYYSSATSFTRLAIKHNVTAAALSGATTVVAGAIPAKAIILGVATTTTTTITGASGYQVGDGSDADRWGDITGTAVGTDSDYNDYTAAPIPAWSATAQDITLTAKTSNFTGGVVQVDVAYIVSEAD